MSEQEATEGQKTLVAQWLELEVKRLGSAMSYALGARQHEIAEAYHEKYLRAQFLLKEELGE